MKRVVVSIQLRSVGFSFFCVVLVVLAFACGDSRDGSQNAYEDGGSGGSAGAGGSGGGIGGAGGWCGPGSENAPGPEHPSVSSARFRRVSVGDFSCGIDEAKQVICWGGSPFSTEPPDGAFKDLSVGACQACAVDTDGRIQCWGCPPGDGGVVPPEGTFSAVSVGYDHICGLRVDGTVSCSGMDDTTLVPVGSFRSVVSGLGASCGIERSSGSGNVKCWGRNDLGQGTPPSVMASTLGAGAYHFCAISSEGLLRCWGRDIGGLSGAPSGRFRAVDETCALSEMGDLTCWGSDSLQDTPDGCFAQVDASSTHACAVRQDGHVVCWGANANGEASPP